MTHLTRLTYLAIILCGAAYILFLKKTKKKITEWNIEDYGDALGTLFFLSIIAIMIIVTFR